VVVDGSCRLGQRSRVSHITTIVRLGAKRGPYLRDVHPVSHPACRIKDCHPNNINLNSYAQTHSYLISFIL
jgi:hypothetical protein